MKRFCLFLMLFSATLLAQDQVDVTFRYSAPSSPTIFVVGEFNGWNNSANAMDFQGNNLWTKTVRLAVGPREAVRHTERNGCESHVGPVRKSPDRRGRRR